MNFKHTDFTGFSGQRVHLGVTGSVSAFRAVDIMRRLQRADITVGVTLTGSAQQFIQPLQFRSLTSAPVYEALFEPNQAAYAHLEPAQNASVFLTAPATANILGKHAHGIADDLLSSQLLAFPGPVIHAPAMNPRLWNSFPVRKNIALLTNHDILIVPPESGRMACGEIGEGRLAHTEEIFLTTLKALLPQEFSGLRILINLGPTQEFWDPVRVLTNNSSGVMGASIALAAWLRGAEVTVICGPVSDLWFPRWISPIHVTSAQQMHQACLDAAPGMDIICLTSAVSDYKPAEFLSEKVKKSTLGNVFSLPLLQNPDVLSDIGSNKRKSQYLVGFAAETSNLKIEAARKMKDKNLDLIVANNIAASGSGFGSALNQVSVFDANGRTENWPILPKTEVAMRIIEWIIDYRA